MQITATNLGHRFQSSPMIFSDLNFSLSPGGVTGVIGPSGSGKSTLLSLLAQWEVPAEGELSLVGIQNTKWVFQNPFGVPNRTAIDHVSFPLLADGSSRKEATEKAKSIMEQFGIASLSERPFHSLSGGEAQRLMLARGLISAPSLLLVDEPTAQLDHVSARTVNHALQTIANTSTIVVVATHDPQTQAACELIIDLGETGLASRGQRVTR